MLDTKFMKVRARQEELWEECEKYWSRVGGIPNLEGLSLLDVGSGHGNMAIMAAQAGAKRVVGVDTSDSRIDFCKKVLTTEFSQYQHVIDYQNQDICNYTPGFKFDYVISFSSFEHIVDLENGFNAMYELLKPGGRMFIGFGPLYNSPFGDHGWTQVPIPWGHVFLSERFIVDRINRKNAKRKISQIEDLGLNKWPLSRYRELFEKHSSELEFYKENHGDSSKLKALRLLASLPFMHEFFTNNIYFILRKKSF